MGKILDIAQHSPYTAACITKLGCDLLKWFKVQNAYTQAVQHTCDLGKTGFEFKKMEVFEGENL